MSIRSNFLGMDEKEDKKTPIKPLRKGSLVKVNKSIYLQSLELKASDGSPPSYIFEGPGELLAVKGEYAQIRWRMPVPDVWLRIDQLEEWN